MSVTSDVYGGGGSGSISGSNSGDGNGNGSGSSADSSSVSLLLQHLSTEEVPSEYGNLYITKNGLKPPKTLLPDTADRK